jgi:hypothetical protein
MAIRFIQKRSGATTATEILDDATGRIILPNLPSATSLAYDTVSNSFKFNKNGHIVALADTSGTQTNTANIGAAAGTGVTAVEYGNGLSHTTVLTLVNTPITMRDTEQGGGVKIYDFPLGSITITGAVATVTETTTSTLASTLHASSTLNWGVGSATQTNATLVTTEQNIVNVTAATSSATINVANTATTGAGGAVILNGTGTAADAYLNAAAAAAGDITGDATTVWNGTVTINWQFNGAA